MYGSRTFVHLLYTIYKRQQFQHVLVKSFLILCVRVDSLYKRVNALLTALDREEGRERGGRGKGRRGMLLSSGGRKIMTWYGDKRGGRNV